MSPAHQTNNMAAERLLIAVTGASGMLYLRAFLKVIAGSGIEVHGICSSSGRKVLRMEEGVEPADLQGIARWFAEDDFTAPPASGSSRYRGMAVLPCSMGTLAAIASGLSVNLIHRAADVMLKERRTLVLAVRETPLNRNHLQNMLRAHDAGAIICPPMPAHYLQPATLEEAAETYAWRLADQLGIAVAGRKRWGEEPTC